MIETKKGNTQIRGKSSEITVDIFIILRTALDECPVELLKAFELFDQATKKEMQEAEEGSTEDERLSAFTAALAMLPEDKREEIKKLKEDNT